MTGLAAALVLSATSAAASADAQVTHHLRGRSYNVIGSASSVSGTFSAYNFGSTPYTVAYTPTAVTVTVPTGGPNAAGHHPHT